MDDYRVVTSMTAPPRASITVTGLTYRYPGKLQPAIENIDLTVKNGDLLAVIGSSGCGKSTFLHCLTGLIPQASEGEMHGRVVVCGLDTKLHPLSKLATVANIVFQDPDVGFFCSKVEDEIGFGPRNLGLDDAEIRRRIQFALESTRIEHLRTRRVVDLSGGEKQRLAIASALSMLPKVLVLDEPTSDLDREGARSTAEVLQSLRTNRGMTVVVAEHRLDELSRYLDRVLVMERGRVVADGSPDAIFDGQRRLLDELGILSPQAVAGMSGSRSVGSETEEARPARPIISRVGCSGLCELKKDLCSREAVLRVCDVAFNYPSGPQVLRDISFEIGRSELVALVGSNGVGKTTLALLVAGLLKPRHGNIVLNGVRKFNGNLGRKIGLLFQNPSRQLFCDSARKEVQFGPRNMRYNDFEKRAREMLDFFGLDRYADVDPHHLSEGEKQRLATASILAARPELLILDEPTTGQDWARLKALMDLLRVYVDQGMSVLLITHDVHLARQYATRVMIMREGTIVADGPVNEVLPHDETKQLIIGAN
jgi:energy-coupling factor transport system ATP-binding protein